MRHEYFADAVDPLRPKSSTSRLLSRKHSSIDGKSQRDSSDGTVHSSRPSWFRKSLIRDNPPALPIQPNHNQLVSPERSPVQNKAGKTGTPVESTSAMKYRPFASKRATWTNGTNASSAAPMPILPSIRPISPFSDTVNAQAHNNVVGNPVDQSNNVDPSAETRSSKKIGRQLSVQSNGNHYADYHRQEAERALNGQRAPLSPSSEQKAGFFSHLRKKARRLSGKPQAPASPSSEDIDANASCGPWQSNRNSMIIDTNMDTILKTSFNDVDKATQLARQGAEPLSPTSEAPCSHKQPGLGHVENSLKRHPPLAKSVSSPSLDSSSFTGGNGGPISSRTRRALHRSTNPSHIYDTPDEEDELLHEALDGAQTADKRMDRRRQADDEEYLRRIPQVDKPRQPLQDTANNIVSLNPYPTPSPSAKRNGVLFDQSMMAEPITPLNISKARPKEEVHPRWPTPPYEENEWAASAAASIFAAGSIYH